MYRFLATLLLSGLTACGAPTDRQAEFYVFGTTVNVTLRDTDESTASRAFSLLQQRFQSMHRNWHPWEPGQLTDINRAFAEGRTIALSEDIAHLIKRSKALENATGGRFNPTIGGLIELWGFHTSNFPIHGPPPAQKEIQELLESKPSSLDIHINGLQVSSSNPAVQLDFSGIAKGYAVDIACKLLREMGVQSGIVNAGGDLRAFGAGPERPWKIAVSKPGGGVIGGITVKTDEAVFTSGIAYRYRENQKSRYPHIIDPATGWPITGLAAVTVIANQGLLADAAATALMVAGKHDWLQVAANLGLDTVLVVDDQGKLFMTPLMQQRLVVDDPNKVDVSIVRLHRKEARR